LRIGHKVWRQVRREFPAALQKSANGARQVGVKTRRDRTITLRRFVYWVVAEYQIHSVTHLKRKHVESYCKDMEQRMLRPATIATELSHLGVLFAAIGKSQLLDGREKLFTDPAILSRSLVAKKDKSIEAAGVDFETIYEAAWALNPRVAVQLALCWYFGLRAQEAWQFRPHLSVRDGFVRVAWGTKGGRRRSLSEPLTDEQRSLIELAKTFVPTESESQSWALRRIRCGTPMRSAVISAQRAIWHLFRVARWHRMTPPLIEQLERSFQVSWVMRVRRSRQHISEVPAHLGMEKQCRAGWFDLDVCSKRRPQHLRRGHSTNPLARLVVDVTAGLSQQQSRLLCVAR
jgi:hypothetical protein